MATMQVCKDNIYKDNIYNDKKAIRKKILADRDSISLAERKKAAVLIKEQICNHPWFLASDILLAFVSYGSEIVTDGIISEALKLGKKVYVPRVDGEEMEFYRIYALTELQEGYKGIREPVAHAEKYVCNCGSVMLMPGAVFDKARNRIGYGKGFYDRYLKDKPGLQERTIGIGFQCQLVEELPADEWDIKPGQVICV